MRMCAEVDYVYRGMGGGWRQPWECSDGGESVVSGTHLSVPSPPPLTLAVVISGGQRVARLVDNVQLSRVGRPTMRAI